MGLYNFKPQFEDAILSGRKRQTIRAYRKHPDRPGGMMHLYTGLRRKGARLLMRVYCTGVKTIQITEAGTVRIDGVTLCPEECERLANSDGFPDFRAMREFWAGRLPFEGNIYYWKAGIIPPAPDVSVWS